MMLTIADGSAHANVPGATGGPVGTINPEPQLEFSSPPKDREFLQTRLFPEPLAPVAGTTPEENRDLARALLAFRDGLRTGGGEDAVGPLITFLVTHQKSAWKPALQLNLGMIYRRTGHFSKALEIWQAGWHDANTLSNPEGRALANAIVARLSQLEAYLGRKELLEPLLDSIQTRSVGGTAAQLITDSHTGLYDMVYHPDQSFRCGPLALLRILKYANAKPSPASLRVLEEESPSTDHGLSLTAVEEIGARAGMKYQAAYRSPGAPVILPSVAHWKVGHYAAIVARDKSGRYLVQDTTFGEDIRVTPATLDEEASGYFLVPTGDLPDGWRPVSAEEGAQIWGRGNTGSNHDVMATGPFCDTGNCTGQGPGGYTTSGVELSVVGLQLHDKPMGYKPPVGPAINIDMYYSHRDAMQPATFSYTNFGPKWTFSWLSAINLNSASGGTISTPGGGGEPFEVGETTPYSQATITDTLDVTTINDQVYTCVESIQLTYPNGSWALYNSVGQNCFTDGSGGNYTSEMFLSSIADVAGNIVTLTYDASSRITMITDAIGQKTTLTYGNSSYPDAVTKITDPFGRFATFGYNANGQLSSITDVLGITSSYMYGQGTDPDFINTLTTPYGSTTFTYGDSTTNANLGSTRFLETVDPLGRASYVEFNQGVDAGDSSGGSLINPSLFPTGIVDPCAGYLNVRNTFVFDANEYALATADGNLNYTMGKVLHWLHSSDTTNASRVKESEKEPLENRIWYNYPLQEGQCSFPVSSTGTFTSGATSQPSAIGRVVDGGATQLQTFQYNANDNVTQATDAVGRQLTYTYAANGVDLLTISNTTNGGSQLLETRTYNSQHLPLTIKRTNGTTAHLAYNVAGQLTRYTDALGHASALSYDGSGHLKTVKGPISGSEFSFAYDNISRTAAITDPAGATVHYTYDSADRPLTATYPDGTKSLLGYTLLDLTSSTDRLQQKTRYSFDADRELVSKTDPAGNTAHLGYNLSGKLSSITDGNGHTTNFGLDLQSRVTAKNYINGTSVSVAYENGLSLIAMVTDALNQTTNYTYNPDNTLATVSYNANQPTPSVSFTYDSIYPRVLSMTDGNGTTTYSYYPVSSRPALGANQLQSVNSPLAGSSGSDTIAYSYDALNRVVGLNVDGEAQSVGYDALGRRVSASNPLDSFIYSYSDATSRVSGVSSSSGPTAAMTYFGPTGDELLEQKNIATHSGGTSLAQFGYTYNADNNVKSITVSAPAAKTTQYGYDAASRLISGLFSGSSPQYVYGYDHASNLTSITPNGTTENYSYTSVNTPTAGSYDSNGSTTTLSGNTYTWDGANRVATFANAANHTSSTFTYDGLSRLVRVVDSTSGTVTADHTYTWCGAIRCLAHDNTQTNSPVSTQYFEQGAIASGSSYYYVRDLLGSVTQLVSTTGGIAVQYTYDPYGNQTIASGTAFSDIGYGGYFHHAVSGLNFAMYRAYDTTHARWLNRDPMGEAGGINLYAYVGGNPVSLTDPLGFCPNSSNSPNYYVAGRLDFTSLFAVWTTNSNDWFPSFLGLYRINNAPCILVCFLTPSEWNNAQTNGPAPVPPSPMAPPPDGST